METNNDQLGQGQQIEFDRDPDPIATVRSMIDDLSTTMHAGNDRRMLANVAATCYMSNRSDGIAWAVKVAREIVAEIDKTEPTDA